MAGGHGRRPSPRGAGPSQRQLRVGELIRALLAELLARGEIVDEAVQDRSITVTEVRVSPDLKHATAFVAPLGGGDPQGVVGGLTRARRFIRGEIAHRLTLRYAPDIEFRADTSFDEAARIDRLLRSDPVRRDIEGPDTDEEG
ncbi:MAG: 30S ribosome-binding factor RbfA [Alphaproteobacteria bacterium]|nr:30S ribosome-binding factor RbfA [Alphaproteobacteria bacterium]